MRVSSELLFSVSSIDNLNNDNSENQLEIKNELKEALILIEIYSSIRDKKHHVFFESDEKIILLLSNILSSFSNRIVDMQHLIEVLNPNISFFHSQISNDNRKETENLQPSNGTVDVIDIKSEVYVVIKNLMPKSKAQMKNVASSLYMSERNLRRKLTTNNSSFQEILTKFRKNQAKEYLLNTDRSIINIALSLGYKSASAFCTSFKHWFDMTPAKFRDKQR